MRSRDVLYSPLSDGCEPANKRTQRNRFGHVALSKVVNNRLSAHAASVGAAVKITNDPLAPQHAADAYNREFLARFYAQRADAILSSGDPVRIRLFCQWLEREQKRERAA